MACAEFEERLLEYAGLAGNARAGVDAHAAHCSACRELLDALHTLDSQLIVEFGGLEVSPSFGPAVRRRIQSAAPMAKPSLVPELLDFVGWGTIAALAGLLAWWLIPLVPVSERDLAFSPNVSLAAAGVFLGASFLVGIRCLADLKH